MTSPKNLIVFPVLDTFLKQLTDGQWRNGHIIRNQWKQFIPPEYFARRRAKNPYYSQSKGRVVESIRSHESIIVRAFKRIVVNSLESGYIELRELGAKPFENYDIRITEKGMVRLREGWAGFKFVTYNGETHSLKGFSQKMDLSYNRFRFWFYEKKVPIEEAIKRSRKGINSARARIITHNGETKTMAEWCRELNIDRAKFDFYLKTMTFEGAVERCRGVK
jgi:hypothetical protein